MSIGGISGTNHGSERRVEDDEWASNAEQSHPTSTAADPASGTSVLLLEGDIAAQIAALAIRSAQQQRETNRDLQLAEETALQRAEQRQVEALHQEATDIRMAGLVDGAAGMASGAFTLAGASTGNEEEKQYYKGGATISEATGKALGSLPRGDQADQTANAAQHEHEAAHHRRNLDAAKDAIREGQDLLERALDFYKQSQQGAADARSSSVRRG